MSNCYGTHPGEVPSSSNLIVNYLPQKLSDQEFYDLFGQIGRIKTCKIVRNKLTGYSYGFGFVDYHDPEDAKKAIGVYNGFKMNNKTLKVAIAKPSNSNHSKNTNVYIRGVPKNFDPDELENLFGTFGRLVQFRVLRDLSTNVNKGVAFALYDDKENADRAIQDMDGKTLNGGTEPLQVKIADDQMKLKKHRQMTSYEQQIRAGGPMHGRPPYVNNFRPNHRFNPMNKNGPGGFQIGQPGGYGHGSQNVGGGGAGIGGGGGYDQAPVGPPILFVYNIGMETDDPSLVQLFSQYGTVEKAAVVRDKMTTKSKGYGFVTMPNYNEALWAIDQLNGFQYAGKPLQVSFKTAGKASMGPMGSVVQSLGPTNPLIDGMYEHNEMPGYGAPYHENIGYGNQQPNSYGKRTLAPFYQ
ncbi:ELAV-like protein 1 [Galendromus occidentalis]|uniref:ELAV-like protein 1 n=1 Tax=Galendromus occidentalis TaxID=34638 RepID=A0AAJ6QR04_9ACAR|nr:ELAV-like protein 1 [Galendromus occidentalis]